MSDKNEQNPYDNRNHDDPGIQNRDDVLAVAGLLGQVTGSLGEIDKQQVGSDSQFIRAKKIDPKQALNNIVGGKAITPIQPVSNVNMSAPIPTPSPVPVPVPVPAPAHQVANNPDLEKRVSELERAVESYFSMSNVDLGCPRCSI